MKVKNIFELIAIFPLGQILLDDMVTKMKSRRDFFFKIVEKKMLTI